MPVTTQTLTVCADWHRLKANFHLATSFTCQYFLKEFAFKLKLKIIFNRKIDQLRSPQMVFQRMRP